MVSSADARWRTIEYLKWFLLQTPKCGGQRKSEVHSLSSIESAARQGRGLPPLSGQRRTPRPGPTPDRCARAAAMCLAPDLQTALQMIAVHDWS